MTRVILVCLLAYLVGAVPFGLLIARARGVDLRAVGSGNIGASNAWRALGPALGTLVFVLDVLKGFAGPELARRVVGPGAFGVIALCGTLAVIGHTFPVFLGFKGGKGVATGLGVGLGLVWVPVLAAFALWGAVLGVTRYISVASLAALAFAVVFAVALRAPWPYVAVILATAVTVWIKHIPNLKRLRAGTEPQVGRKKVTAGETS